MRTCNTKWKNKEWEKYVQHVGTDRFWAEIPLIPPPTTAPYTHDCKIWINFWVVWYLPSTHNPTDNFYFMKNISRAMNYYCTFLLNCNTCDVHQLDLMKLPRFLSCSVKASHHVKFKFQVCLTFFSESGFYLSKQQLSMACKYDS